MNLTCWLAVVRMVFLPLLMLFSASVMGTDINLLSQENLRPGVTEISRDVYGLHNYVMWICLGIAVVVYGVLVFSLFKYRKSRGAKAAKFSHSLKAEVVWTIVPVILLVMMAVPSIQVLARMYDSSASELDILVTGYQWKWGYEYLDEGVKFISSMQSENDDYTITDQMFNSDLPKDTNYLLNVDNPLVIPINTKVRFLVTSNDVLHSWWVPDFAVKRDAVPGYVNESWAIVEEPGVYRGQCTELCGAYHGFMPVVVHALPKDEYKAWMDAQKAQLKKDADQLDKDWLPEDLLARGAALYATNCVACHQSNGQGNVPAFPALVGSPKVVGDKSLTINILLNGVNGSAMQAFGKQLNDADIAAVVSYIRSAWGNNPDFDKDKGARVVQPAEIAAAR